MHYQKHLDLFKAETHHTLFKQCLHGLERETLRIDQQGRLAMTPHPCSLGSALMHPCITTDYAEAMLEFITPPTANLDNLLDTLEVMHRYAHSKLQHHHEQLWHHSMPGLLPNEKDILVAHYGISLPGQLKHVYRRGLSLRYGRYMMCITGMHYNYSFPETFWSVLQVPDTSTGYLSLIRQYHRTSWLLVYLFGATPAMDRSFFCENNPNLRNKEKKNFLKNLDILTCYAPYGTSLRMSDLGYQSTAQKTITPCFNDLNDYIQQVTKALHSPYAQYESLGTHDAAGQWQQINTHILQIENEYYATIRPKRSPENNEQTLQALTRRGIQYVEVRCLDVDPFSPIGISKETACFLEAYLLFCALSDSPAMTVAEQIESTHNFTTTAQEGRRPALMLYRKGHPIALSAWGEILVDKIAQAAKILDLVHQTTNYTASVSIQNQKIRDPGKTPSARILNRLKAAGRSHREDVLYHSQQYAADFQKRPLKPEQQTFYDELARTSLAAQKLLEKNNSQVC